MFTMLYSCLRYVCLCSVLLFGPLWDPTVCRVPLLKPLIYAFITHMNIPPGPNHFTFSRLKTSAVVAFYNYQYSQYSVGETYCTGEKQELDLIYWHLTVQVAAAGSFSACLSCSMRTMMKSRETSCIISWSISRTWNVGFAEEKVLAGVCGKANANANAHKA